jgi:Transglutaminase-like superfamily
MPSADVVIGVEPRKNAPLFAHAWVEMNGVPLDPADVAGTVIARLFGTESPGRGAAEGP